MTKYDEDFAHAKTRTPFAPGSFAEGAEYARRGVLRRLKEIQKAGDTQEGVDALIIWLAAL